MLYIGMAAVIPHELAHILCAKLWGYDVAKLEILPIGAVARIDGIIESNPVAEMAIALSGPFTNIIIATIIMAITPYTKHELIKLYLEINVAMAMYNLLPALPLDGGRAARSMLSHVMGLKNATLMCAWLGIFIGAIMAAVAIGLAISGTINIFLFTFGIFLTISAFIEKKRASYIFLIEITDKKTQMIEHGAMKIRQIAARHDTPLHVVVERFRPRAYHMVLIVDDNMKPLCTVNEAQVVRAMMNLGYSTELNTLVPLGMRI
jgi:stage IV sporulation protein FB